MIDFFTTNRDNYTSRLTMIFTTHHTRIMLSRSHFDTILIKNNRSSDTWSLSGVGHTLSFQSCNNSSSRNHHSLWTSTSKCKCITHMIFMSMSNNNCINWVFDQLINTRITQSITRHKWIYQNTSRVRLNLYK